MSKDKDNAEERAEARAEAAEKAKAEKESAKHIAETKKPHVYRTDMGESLP